MKNFAKITLASLVLAVSSSAMAGGNIDVTVEDNPVIQTQDGTSNEQYLNFATVSLEAVNALDGNMTISALNNSIIQDQTGAGNHQSMKIATIGCDCSN